MLKKMTIKMHNLSVRRTARKLCWCVASTLRVLAIGCLGDFKVFVDLMNNPRNELKHRMSGKPLEFNLEEEAVNFIQRAIDNFQQLRPGPNVAFRRFENEASAWYRRFSEQRA